MDYCSKCGMSTDSGHKEETCDFPGIDWDNIEELTKVEDIQITDIKIKTGYGVYELAKIYKIMTDIWNNPPIGAKKVSNQYLGFTNQRLFLEAEKIYKERLIEEEYDNKG